MRPRITDLAQGKWPSILPQLGLSKDFLSGRHGPCPMCGGKDRFRFANMEGRGNFFCNQCGTGNGMDLVMRLNNLEFKEAAKEVAKLIEGSPVTPIRAGRPISQVKEEMNGIWRHAKALDRVPPAVTYWHSRVGEVPTAKDLRGAVALRCGGYGDWPAMVALIRGLDGKAVNLHRTFLSREGAKAHVPEPRRVMDIGMPKGCAVRLTEPGGVIGIAEGLETAESCRIMFGIPTWAALNAENMKSWEPPDLNMKVIIFGENDRSYTGQAASLELAKRLMAKKVPVEVRIHGITVDPSTVGCDWNDLLQTRLGKSRDAA